jgi:predicted metal-binding membrane protein
VSLIDEDTVDHDSLMAHVPEGPMRLVETIMHDSSVLESVLERDRTIVIAGLVTVIVLSWLYILLGAGMSMTAFEMTTMSMPGSSSQMDMAGDGNGMSAQKGMGGTMRMAHAALMQSTVWTPSYAVLMFCMWWIMMVAMMLPSASPMVLLFARIQRSQKVKGAPFVSTSIFAMGYLVTWGVFSMLAASTQWGLERVGLLSTMMVSTSGLFGGYSPSDGGNLPAYAPETRVSQALSQSAPVRYASLASRNIGRFPDGH